MFGVFLLTSLDNKYFRFLFSLLVFFLLYDRMFKLQCEQKNTVLCVDTILTFIQPCTVIVVAWWIITGRQHWRVMTGLINLKRCKVGLCRRGMLFFLVKLLMIGGKYEWAHTSYVLMLKGDHSILDVCSPAQSGRRFLSVHWVRSALFESFLRPLWLDGFSTPGNVGIV